MECIWVNELGGLTFAVGDDRFVKWAPAGSGLPMSQEVDRLRWAGKHTQVPTVVDHGTDEDGCDWLLTLRLPGEIAVSERWLRDPRGAARGLG